MTQIEHDIVVVTLCTYELDGLGKASSVYRIDNPLAVDLRTTGLVVTFKPVTRRIDAWIGMRVDVRFVSARRGSWDLDMDVVEAVDSPELASVLLMPTTVDGALSLYLVCQTEVEVPRASPGRRVRKVVRR